MERKFKALSKIIFALEMEQFGVEESKSKNKAPAKPNRRQKEAAQIKRELRSPRKQYRKANTGEKLRYNNLEKP